MLKDFIKKGFVNEMWQIYAYMFFMALFFGQSIILLYYQANGLSLVQIGFLTSIVYLANLICEYPTGIIADKFGRKLSLLIAMFFYALQAIILFLIPTFHMIVLASAFVGIAWSFQSGAYQAIVYDSLKSSKKEKNNKFVLGFLDSVYGAGVIISAIAGPFLYQISKGLPFLLSAIAFLIGLFVLSTYSEPKYKSKKEKVEFKEAFFEGIKLNIQNKTLLILLLIPLSLFFYEHAWTETGQILLTNSGFPIIFLGFFFAIRSLLMIFGGIFLPKLVHKLKTNRAIFIALVVQSLGLIFIAHTNPYVMALFAHFLYFSHVFWNYIEADIIHKHIPSKIRATTLSAKQMLTSFVFIFNPWFMTYLVQEFGKSIFILFGILAFVITAVIVVVGRKHII